MSITLLLGNRGYKLSIAQAVGSGSVKDHHVEVALLDSGGSFVNAGYWWHDATYDQINDDRFDDVVSRINANDLQKVIVKATAWVLRYAVTYKMERERE